MQGLTHVVTPCQQVSVAHFKNPHQPPTEAKTAQRQRWTNRNEETATRSGRLLRHYCVKTKKNRGVVIEKHSAIQCRSIDQHVSHVCMYVPPPQDEVQCVQSVYFQWNSGRRFSVAFSSGTVYSSWTPGFCDWNSSWTTNIAFAAIRWLVHWPLMGAARPRPLVAVPNVTAHKSTASVPTSYCSTSHYNCLCVRLEWLSEMSNDAKHRAVSLRQLSWFWPHCRNENSHSRLAINQSTTTWWAWPTTPGQKTLRHYHLNCSRTRVG